MPHVRRELSQPRWKRSMDVVVATLGALATSPLVVVGLAQSRLLLKENPIFRQERVGLNGVPFELLKIRTMGTQPPDASTVSLNRDVRVPSKLRWIREFKVDELPQIMNVLKGDMSIVGPRPTVQSDVDRMDSRARQRHDVRPGLTGLSQIRGNAGLSWPEKIEYDLEYIEFLGFLSDVKIIGLTVLAVIRREASASVDGGDEWRTSGSHHSHRG